MQLRDIHLKYYSNMPEGDFWHVVQADPTYDAAGHPQKKGKYTQWLLHAYKRGTITTETLDECTFLLGVFHRYYQLLAEKDIMKYDTLQKLRDALAPYLDDPYAEEHETSKAMRIRKIKEGADKVYEDEEWVVFVPHTWEASRYYGKGTRWCTAYDSSDTFFIRYNSQGPLYININRRTKEKWQFHFETKTFCDAEDNSVDINEVLQSMSEGLQEFYRDKVQSKATQRTWHTFNEVWAEWLLSGCQGEVDFQYCEQADGEVFAPAALPASVTSVANLFQHCHRLRRIDLSGWDVSAIDDFSGMFRMCDHLESVDLSGWTLPATANLQGMFQYSGIQSIRMHGCDMGTIRSIFAVTEEECSNPDLRLELTPGTREYDAYQELIGAKTAFKAMLSRRFDSNPDMTQTHGYLLELTAQRERLRANPIYATTHTDKLKAGLANILRRGCNLLEKDLTFTFNTYSDGWGLFLFSRPNLDDYLARLSRRHEDARLALEIADSIRTRWEDIPGLSAELETLTSEANDILSAGECTKALALEHLQAAGFKDRTYVTIPKLAEKVDQWKGEARSGAQHLRMSKDTLQSAAIFVALLIPLLLVLAAAPWIGVFMAFVCAYNIFMDERSKDAAKISLLFSLIVACMTAFSWFIVRPAAIWIMDNVIVDKQEESLPSYDDESAADYQLPYLYLRKDTTSQSGGDALPLTIGRRVLSREEVMLAREDTVPFSEHILSSGITIGDWCVEAMADEYKLRYGKKKYDTSLLRVVKSITRDGLQDKEEQEVREIVSQNNVTFRMLLLDHSKK